ncbi:MAG TPA: hypothetical protein VLX44_08910 [Xanthobacteraceae bacterium]|nr:hypothetical protein [Xanthobacteraceae bacterium]
MTNHSFALAPAASTPRSSSAIYAAVAAVGIISGTLVTLQLSVPPSAGATTVAAAPLAPITQTVQSAKTWDLEARWWGGETHVAQPAPAATQATIPAAAAATPAHADVPESELTFTKGYALRLAARQAAGQVEQVAELAPAAEGKAGVAHPAVVARNTAAPVRTATAPASRSLAAPTPVAAPIDPPAAADAGSQTLAFDEPRGFATPPAAVFPNLFGRLY